MEAALLLPRLIHAAGMGPWAVVDEVAAALVGLGFSERRVDGPHGAVLFERGEAMVVLSGHVDVVPVGVGWTREPFGGEIAEGRIWGRGACDMLGAVACFVEAAARARDAPCAILLTPDEETAMLGATRALDEGLVRAGARIVVGEPTHHAVGVAEKGVLWLRLHAAGRNAHGSMPELGDNAAERLVRVLPRVLAAAPVGSHATLGKATCNLGRLEAGEAVNQVPAKAHADIDIRYLPIHTEASVIAHLEKAAAESGEAVRFEVLSSHVPFEGAPDGPFQRACLEAVAAAGIKAPVALGLPYGTEASKFAPAGHDVVILGPGEPGLAHTNRESIALDDLARGVSIYAHLLNTQEKTS